MDYNKEDFVDFIIKKLNPKRYEYCHDSHTNEEYFIYSSKLGNQLLNSSNKSSFDTWEKIFDLYYSKINGSPISTGDTSVWIDSNTNKTIPKLEMEEWVQLTISNIKRFLEPNSQILEIGCGNGLILEKLIDHVDMYIGIETSKHAIDSIKNSTIYKENKCKIKLYKLSAVELFKLKYTSFDFIVINSVCQYFPNLEYLIDVISQLGSKLKPKSFVYIGDIRSYELANLQYIERSKYAPELRDKKDIINFHRKRERETLFSELVFKNLSNIFPWVNSSIISKKLGVYKNEMSKYRFDVSLICKNENLSDFDHPENSFSLCWFHDKLNLSKVIDLILNLTEHQLCSIKNFPNENLKDVFNTSKNYFPNFCNRNVFKEILDLPKIKDICDKNNLYIEILTSSNPFLSTLRFSKCLILLNQSSGVIDPKSLINFSNRITSKEEQVFSNFTSSYPVDHKIITKQVDDKIFDLKV